MIYRVGVVAFLLGLASPSAGAQTMVPSHQGACPSGSSYAGSGYCRSNDRAYVPAQNGSCPTGSSYAGAGYCGASGGTGYVPASHGACPSGSSYAGAGYCKLR